MEKITVYKADDGRIFMDEKDCREHDFRMKLNALDERVEFFDGWKQPLPLTAEGYASAKYLWLDNSQMITKLKEVCRYWGRNCRGLKKRGMYQWNALWYSWEPFDVTKEV